MILRVLYHGGSAPQLVGRLGEDLRTGRIFFEYDAAWLGTGRELSPFHLPCALGTRPSSHDQTAFENLHGLFWDTLPDHWGRLVWEKYLGASGLDPAGISPLGRLAYAGSRAVGALGYEPEAHRGSEDKKLAEAIQLARLDRDAARLAAEEKSTPSALLFLLQAGASAGGAKPKALLYFDDSMDAPSFFPGKERSPWIVKFSSVPHTHKDSREEGRVEYAYALMAHAAGLCVPESRLLEIETPKGKRALFAVRRFDLPGNGVRLHQHTLAGLRHIHHQAPGFSYEIIADTLLRVTGDRREIRELARRAAFNLLAGNRDDHSKNFSLLMDATGQWRQAPAYDLTPSPGPGRQGIHVASLNASQSPGQRDFLDFAKRVDLPDAGEIFEKVRQAVCDWPVFAKQAGLREVHIKKIARFHHSDRGN